MKYLLLLVATLTTALGLSAQPSQETIDSFVKTLETSWTTDGIDTYCASYDVDALCERTLEKTGASNKFRTGFKNGVGPSFLESSRKSMQQFESAKFLRVRQHEGHSVLVFRLLSDKAGLSYIHLLLQKNCPPEKIVIVDQFAASAGEWTSQAMRRLTLSAIVDDNKSAVAKLFSPQEADIVKWAPKMARAIQAMHDKKWQEALNAFEKFPDSLRTQSSLFTLRVQCAQNISNEKYLHVLAEWEKIRPTDTALNLLAIDGYFLRKDYSKAHQAIERLDQSVGGDPYLRLLRSYFYTAAEQLAEAEDAAITACKEEPGLFSAWDQRIGVQLKQKKWSGLGVTLNAFDRAFPSNSMHEIIQGTEYEEFRQSEDYTRWLNSRPGSEHATP
jgi:hypothetical protein